MKVKRMDYVSTGKAFAVIAAVVLGIAQAYSGLVSSGIHIGTVGPGVVSAVTGLLYGAIVGVVSGLIVGFVLGILVALLYNFLYDPVLSKTGGLEVQAAKA
jgi:hypothetical protein